MKEVTALIVLVVSMITIAAGCAYTGFALSEYWFIKDCLNNGKTQVGKRWFYCAEK